MSAAWSVEDQRQLDIANERREWAQVLASLDRVAEYAVAHRMERYGDDNAGLLLHEWTVALERRLGRSLPSGGQDPRPSLGVGKCLAVFDRDGFRCKHCGTQRHLTVDHITPRSRGGTNDFENLQTLCGSCNSRKGTR